MGATRAMRQRKRGVTYTKGEIVEQVAEMFRTQGEPVTYHRFARWSGIPAWQIYQHFRSWHDLRVEAGLPRSAPNLRNIPVEQLLAELHAVVQKLQHWPTVSEYQVHSLRNYELLYKKIGPWPAVQARYREWQQSANAEGEPSATFEEQMREWWNPQRAAEMNQQICWMREKWLSLRVGFELKSSDFCGRPEDCCDLLVVLDHDWPQCPLPVLEYSSVFREGRG